ncbi:MAG TPA: S-layer homology domain-containing protein, partial [Candidatus Flavonifractor avistercoris]|nr:S-layer homology domain-containing protein [Candidatus Flavonifractor avistercoris]
MKKRLLASFLAVCLAASLLPAPAFAAGETEDYGHSNHEGYSKWDTSNSLPKSSGKYYLSTDVEISSVWTVPDGGVTLCLNGRNINLKGKNISVGEDVSLVICDCSKGTTQGWLDESEHLWKPGTGDGESCDLTGGVIYGGKGAKGKANGTGAGGGAVYVEGGRLTLAGGNLAGNQSGVGYSGSTNLGGAVRLGIGSSFTMTGGSITGNWGSTGGGVSATLSPVYLYGGEISHNYASDEGGGVAVAGETSTMTDGFSITENEAGVAGGGIKFSEYVHAVKPASFIMSGGKVAGNSAQTGGGVYIDEEKGIAFTMSGGMIQENSAKRGEKSYGRGGGVYLAGGIFTLTDGSIKSNNSDNNGGGIYLQGDDPCLKLSGGTIQDNHAGGSAGGVGYSNSGKPVIELSGSPVVTGNTKGDSGLDNNINLIISFAKLTIFGTLSKDAQLGVTPGSSDSGEVFTSGWSSHNYGADYDTIFTSDDSDFVVLPSEDDKELMFHKHSISYSADNETGTITGTCTCGAEISAWLDGETERTYNGQPQEFSYKTSDNWGDFVSSDLEVEYYDNSTTYPVPLNGAPADVGSYLAVLDGPGLAYATLAFSIKRGTPDLAVTASPAALTGGGRVTLTVTGAPEGADVTVSCDDSSIYLTQEGGVWYADLPADVKSYTFTAKSGATKNYTEGTAARTVAVPAQPVTPDPEPSDPGSSSGGSTSVRRYNIEADAGRGGDISPDGRVRVRRGENQTFRITADDGWEIADVEVDGESVGAVERYTFENVRTDHTISVTFRQIVTEPEEPEAPALPFTDVSEGDWYHDAVAYCWENGIMDGTSGTAFAPNMLLNRAMMAQVLYNLAGGTPAAAAGFPDVSPTAWYADAVNWAAANGYVTGYDNGLFGPEDDLTREQLAAILYRYAGSPAPAGSLDGFADAASASAYAVDALRWAVGEGLLTG